MREMKGVASRHVCCTHQPRRGRWKVEGGLAVLADGLDSILDGLDICQYRFQGQAAVQDQELKHDKI